MLEMGKNEELEASERSEGKGGPESSESSKRHERHERGKLSRARKTVLTVVFASVVLGLVVGNGWGTLCSMGVDAVAYLCPLGMLETMIAAHTAIPRAVVCLAVAVVVIALFGRFFCGWACPVPTIGRFFHPERRQRSGRRDDSAQATVGQETGRPASCCEDAAIGRSSDENDHAAQKSECGGSCSSCGLRKVGGKRDGLRLDSRHGVLLGALAASFACGFPVFCLVCPVGLSFATVVCVYQALCQQTPTVSLAVFPAILLVELVFFRKWCHKICPMGAFMSLLSAKAPFLRPRVDETKCLRSQGVDCRSCVRVCPEELDPHSKSIPECTKCGKCVDACPAKAIGFRRARRVKAEPAVADER